MKHLFHRKQKISLFTWFRVGLLGVLLVGAGALYTPYPAELVKALTEDGKTTRKKKKRKKPTPPPAEPAPAAPKKPAAKKPIATKSAGAVSLDAEVDDE